MQIKLQCLNKENPIPDICKECGRPLSEHKLVVDYYTLPDGSEEDYEGYVCPEPKSFQDLLSSFQFADLSEGDLSDGRKEAGTITKKERLE